MRAVLGLIVDGLVLVLIFLAIGLVGARSYGGSVLAWLRAELKAGRESTFAPQPGDGPCTVRGDARVANMVVKQRALGKRMRREGRTLLADKAYTPVLTKAVPPPVPPKAAQVYPIRRKST